MDTHISVSAWARVEHNWIGKNFPIMRILSRNNSHLSDTSRIAQYDAGVRMTKVKLKEGKGVNGAQIALSGKSGSGYDPGIDRKDSADNERIRFSHRAVFIGCRANSRHFERLACPAQRRLGLSVDGPMRILRHTPPDGDNYGIRSVCWPRLLDGLRHDVGRHGAYGHV